MATSQRAMATVDDHTRTSSEGPKLWRIPHGAIVRSPGLLPMLYRPGELAEELGIEARDVREWAHRGLAFSRDGRGNIWINGDDAKAWVQGRHRGRRKAGLAANEAFCFGCRQVVVMSAPKESVNGGMRVLSDHCPHCGTRVNRGVRNGQQGQFPEGESLSLSIGRSGSARR